MEIWPGKDHPLGAHADAEGTNFALFSDGAQTVHLCLFDDAGAETRLPLTEVDGYVWHGYVPGVGAGPCTPTTLPIRWPAMMRTRPPTHTVRWWWRTASTGRTPRAATTPDRVFGTTGASFTRPM